MTKLEGYKKVAVIFMENNIDARHKYHYALYDESICEGDKVLVTGKCKSIQTITTIMSIDDFLRDPEDSKIDITAEVMCKIDTSAYDERCKKRKRAEELRKEMIEKRKEIEKRKDDEYYAKMDTEYAKMLEELKSNLGV